MIEQNYTARLPKVFWERGDMWAKRLADITADSSHPDTWDILANLVVSLKAKVVVEAGTYRGHATLAMAEAMSCYKIDGYIHTADVEDHGVNDLLRDVGLDSFATFYKLRFETMLRLVKKPIDLAFIDASEIETPTLRLDYITLVAPLLSENGVIVVDDATHDGWPYAAVLRQECALYLPIGHGLAIFQRQPQ